MLIFIHCGSVRKITERPFVQSFGFLRFPNVKADFMKEVFCTIALLGNLWRKPGNLNREGITISSFILL